MPDAKAPNAAAINLSHHCAGRAVTFSTSCLISSTSSLILSTLLSTLAMARVKVRRSLLHAPMHQFVYVLMLQRPMPYQVLHRCLPIMHCSVMATVILDPDIWYHRIND